MTHQQIAQALIDAVETATLVPAGGEVGSKLARDSTWFAALDEALAALAPKEGGAA